MMSRACLIHQKRDVKVSSWESENGDFKIYKPLLSKSVLKNLMHKLFSSRIGI